MSFLGNEFVKMLVLFFFYVVIVTFESNVKGTIAHALEIKTYFFT